MIYLIGGSPRSGKTTLSLKLSKELGIPYISTDYLRLVVMAGFTKEEKLKNFPFEKMIEKAGIESFFKNCTGKEMLEADIQESKFVYNGVKGFLDHILMYKTDYIIEGFHLLPQYIKEFNSNPFIKNIILIKNDTEHIYNGLYENKNNDDWISDNIKDDNTLLLAAKSLSAYGDYLLKESKQYNIDCINTQENFIEVINSLVKK